MVQESGSRKQARNCRHYYRPGAMRCGRCGRKISQRSWLRKVVQAIRDRYPDGQPLSRGDRAVIIGLLKHHPDADEKIGCGVRDVFVHSYVGNGRCFWIVRKDGSLANFSIHRAIRGSSPQEPNEKTQAAMAAFDERRALRAYRAAMRARRGPGRAA